MSTDAVASACVDALGAILRTRSKVVFCRELQREWSKHRSRYAATWLKAMFARKRVVFLVISTGTFEKKAKASGISTGHVEALLKDSHVVVLSETHPAILVTTDENLRSALNLLPLTMNRYRQIKMLNPCNLDALEHLSGAA
jgi:hypothetical protein